MLTKLRTLVLSVTILSLTCAGCLKTSRTAGPVSPKEQTLADAAESFSRAYIASMNKSRDEHVAGLVDVTRDTISRAAANEFKDVTAVNDHFTTAAGDVDVKATATFKAERAEAIKKLIEAMNQTFKDEKDKPGSETVPMFREMLEGFERAIPKKKGK